MCDETHSWINEKDQALSTEDCGRDLSSVQALQRRHQVGGGEVDDTCGCGHMCMLVYVCVCVYIYVYMCATLWKAPNWLVGNLSTSL